MSKLSKIVTVLVLVLTLGLHWAFLQSVAWVSMIVKYSQQYPLRQAIVMTFDGQHPCSICVCVSQGRQQEQRQSQEQNLTIVKIESVPVEPSVFTFLPPVPEPLWPPGLVRSRPAEAPPYPPPRFA